MPICVWLCLLSPSIQCADFGVAISYEMNFESVPVAHIYPNEVTNSCVAVDIDACIVEENDK